MTKPSKHLGIRIPIFALPSVDTEKFNFHTTAGRPIIVLRLTGTNRDEIQNLINTALAQPFFNLEYCLLFIILDHQAVMPTIYLKEKPRGVYWLFDEKNITEQVFKGAPINSSYWVVLDRMLRVVSISEYLVHEALHKARELVHNCHITRKSSAILGRAPVLIIERLFEPEFCKQLIDYYRQEGGLPSGVMRQVGDVTKGFLDDNFKKRKDCIIQESNLIEGVKSRIGLRLRPLIRQAFHFDASRIERHLVACYDEIDGGFFSPHIDNSTAATQHRKFAVTINLNAEEYEGGDLYFPEFGDDVYRAPTGGAVVFSGSLLHGVTRVTQGTRYAYLPFLFGEQEKAIRDASKKLIVPHK